MLRFKSTDDVCKLAEEALERGDYNRALRIGRELNRRRFSYGFEVLARAHAGLDDIASAIGVLEEGVARVPEIDILWHLLGCHYSDTGRYADAHRAFSEYIKLCPPDDCLGQLNEAVVYWRDGHAVEALRVLDSIPESATTPHSCVIGEQRARILLELDRHEEVIELCGRSLGDLNNQCQRENFDLGMDQSIGWLRARLYAARAEAILNSGGDRDRALADAWTAIQHDKKDESAAEVIRKIELKPLQQGKRFHLLLEGRWHEPVEGMRENAEFLTKYVVLADDIDQALALASRFEPPPVRPSLTVSESEILETGIRDNAGVVFTSPYVFYDGPGNDKED